MKEMVEGEGFEPSKAEPSDLQSDPFGHSGTPPQTFFTFKSEPNIGHVWYLKMIICVRDKDGGGRRIRTFEG